MPSYLNRANRMPIGNLVNEATGYVEAPYTGIPTQCDKWLAISQGHWGWQILESMPDCGYAFRMIGAETIRDYSPHREHWRGGPLGQKYVGRFGADFLAYSRPPQRDFADGSAYRSEAYNKMKPAKPDFSALNFIYELKDLPSMLRQRFVKSGLSDMSSYYLGIKFGWEPLLRDVRNMVQTQRTGQARLAQLLRDNGRPVRRRIKLFDHTTELTRINRVAFGCLQPVLVTQFYANTPTSTIVTGFSDTCWAEGRFKYYLPDGPRDIKWTRKMLGRLNGSTPSPKVIYDMLPWSWLVDWFSNVGDMVSNLDTGVADRLTAQYNYIMRKQEWFSNVQAQGLFRDKHGGTFWVNASGITRRFNKTRVAGGPFHPSIGSQDLNGSQLAILGALGLSRLP